MENFDFHRWKPLIGLSVGLVVAVLFLTIGFWKTVLLVFLSSVGYAIGFYMRKHDLSLAVVFETIVSVLKRR